MSKIIIEFSDDITEVYYKSNKSILYLVATITEDGIVINEHCNKTVLEIVVKFIYLLGDRLKYNYESKPI